MLLSIRVTPNAGKNLVQKISDNSYKIKVMAPPEKGKANELMIKLLAEFLKIKERQISIIAGSTTREKIIEIN